MIKRTFIQGLQRVLSRSFASGATKKKIPSTLGIEYIGGEPTLVKDTRDVELRGIKLKGRSNDLPSMIFFPDIMDTAENWLSYFMNAPNSVLNYRDVYIVYPRNFGSSDWCEHIAPEPAEDLADDIERFMYANKITMATMAGHGFGAKNAMLVGCYKPHLVTGILAYDYAPQDYTYFRAAKTYESVLKGVKDIQGLSRMSFDRFSDHLEDSVQNPKLKSLLEQNFVLGKDGRRSMRFNLDFVLHRFNDLVNWKNSYGIFGGRTRFIFPEYSDFVFLNSNTLSMLKVCVQNNGLHQDINTLPCYKNDNPEENHWIYEQPDLIGAASFRTMDFLTKLDGVHVLLKNRAELVEKNPIPAMRLERADQYAGLYVPSHFHHNWRFNDNPALK